MELTITNIPAISAIYYALLQCGYEFYPIERDAATVEALRGFLLHEGIGCDFFCRNKTGVLRSLPVLAEGGSFGNRCVFYPFAG